MYTEAVLKSPMAALSTMFRTVNRLIALSLGTHREQLEHRTGLTCPRPALLRPPFRLLVVYFDAIFGESQSEQGIWNVIQRSADDRKTVDERTRVATGLIIEFDYFDCTTRSQASKTGGSSNSHIRSIQAVQNTHRTGDIIVRNRYALGQSKWCECIQPLRDVFGDSDFQNNKETHHDVLGGLRELSDVLVRQRTANAIE